MAASSTIWNSAQTHGCRRRHVFLECGHVLYHPHNRHQIVSPVPSHRKPGRRFGQETDAGPAEFTLGMDVVAITTVAMFAAGVAMFVV